MCKRGIVVLTKLLRKGVHIMMNRLLRKFMTVVLSASMVLTSVSIPAYAEEAEAPVVETEVATEVSSEEVEPTVAETQPESVAETVVETVAETETATEETTTEAVTETETETETEVALEEDSLPYIEINQGLGKRVPVTGKADDEALMNDLVAKKQTALMFKIPGSDADGYTEEQAKAAVANYSIECKAVNNGTEAENNELSCNGDSFDVLQTYDRDGDLTKGYYAVARFPEGPDKGSYNFHAYETKDGNKTEIAANKGVNFYETQKLNILVVPVKTYWSKKYDGGAPSDACVASAKDLNYPGLNGGADTAWSSLCGELKTYLLDVYPVADINIEEGNEIDASDASFDMCSSDGQKKLWEEACKLQTKDKETGKDKYDLILAFVAYRQDQGGGQGFTFGKPTNIITYTDKDMFPTVAHEIAHCYQVGDEYDGGSFNPTVNQVPSGYKGRNFVSGEENYAPETTNADYWQSPKQYTGSNKDKITDGNPAGTMVSLALHPYSYSQKKLITWAKDDSGKLCPTISYMGSNYSGNDGYYWTSSVIWEHLFKQLMVKEKKEESSENNENNEGSSLTNADVYYNSLKNEDVALESDEEYYEPQKSIFDENDFYYDDDYRFGESRMLEVSGWAVFTDGNLSKIEMDPMFSYDGDLEYMDFDDVPDSNLYTFAALDADGKVMTAVDGDPATAEFSISSYNASQNKNLPETHFGFDAPYPDGTAEVVIVKGKVAAGYTKDANVVWSSKNDNLDTSRKVEGYLTYSANDDSTIEMEWDVEYLDASDNIIKVNKGDLYTEVYYCPQGDDGDVIYITDSEDDDKMYEADAETGYTLGYVSIDKASFPESNQNAYIWVKVTDGINGYDIFSDENDVSINYSTITLAGAGLKKVTDKETKQVTYNVEYTGSAIMPTPTVKVVDPMTGATYTLKKDVDYKITYENNVKPGEATVVIEGIGMYPGRNTASFTINPKSLKTAVPQQIPDATYSANVDNNVKKYIVLNDNKSNQLTLGTDFTVKYGTAVKSGKLVDESDSLTKLVDTLKADGRYKQVDLDGGAKAWKFVDARGKNQDSITVTVVYTGKGIYKEECSKKMTFKLYAEGVGESLDGATIVLKTTSMQYTGKALKPGIKQITLATKKLDKKGNVVKDRDGNDVYNTLPSSKYKVVYTNNVNLGKGRVTIVGKGGYTGTITTTFDIVQKEVTALTVTGVTNQPYTGKEINPDSLNIVVKAGGITLTKGVDYTVEKAAGCDYTNITTAQMKKDKKTPQVVIKLKTEPTPVASGKEPLQPKVKWSSKVKDEKKVVVKTYSIVQANLASTAATTVTVKDKDVAKNTFKDGAGESFTVKAVTDKKEMKKAAFIFYGTADKITTFGKNAENVEAQFANAFVIKYLGTVLDPKYYSINISTTKDGKYGKITIKPKTITVKEPDGKGGEKDTKVNYYKGTRTIKFMYVQNKSEE